MENELPCGTSGRGRSARHHWLSGPMSVDTPQARTPWNTTAIHNGEAPSSSTIAQAPAASAAPPAVQTRRGPKRSVSTPASGLSTRAATVPGRRTMPASRAVPLHSPSTYSGTTSVTPMKDANRRFSTANPSMYWRFLKISMLMSGFSMRRWRRTKAKRHALPTSAGAQMRASAAEKLLALDSPSNSPPNPRVESASESASRRAARSSALPGRMSASAHASNTNPSRASNKKKLRQSHISTMTPPTVGPMFGAKPMATPPMPMAVACLPGGKLAMATFCIKGKSMPVETACSTRPANRHGKFGANRHKSAPASRHASPIRTCCRVLKRLAIHVTAGTVTPSTSM